MKLFHWTCPGGNFGDDLNCWIWPRIAPVLIDDNEDELLIGIGTLLSDILPPAPLKNVFGSGAWEGKPLPVLDDRLKFHCVRGPLTAELLEIDNSFAITDPAILIAKHYQASLDQNTVLDVAYMPHHRSSHLGDWRTICNLAGCRFIDPCGSVEEVLAEIRATKFLITEAMHGAIVADALRVPWIPVKAYPHILEFKWHDWCQSLNIEYQPKRIPSVWNPSDTAGFFKRGYLATKNQYIASRLRQLMRSGRPVLSNSSIHSQRIDELESCLSKLEAEYTVRT